MCEYFCIRFTDFMLKGKRFSDNTELFSPSDIKRVIKDYSNIFNI